MILLPGHYYYLSFCRCVYPTLHKYFKLYQIHCLISVYTRVSVLLLPAHYVNHYLHHYFHLIHPLPLKSSTFTTTLISAFVTMLTSTSATLALHLTCIVSLYSNYYFNFYCHLFFLLTFSLFTSPTSLISILTTSLKSDTATPLRFSFNYNLFNQWFCLYFRHCCPHHPLPLLSPSLLYTSLLPLLSLPST